MSTVEPDGVPITVVRNGPYLVHGSVTLSDDTDVEIPAPTVAAVALALFTTTSKRPKRSAVSA